MPAGHQIIFPEPRKAALEPQEWGSPGPGQVLLKSERTRISSGTELTMLSGDFPRENSAWANYVRYPMPPGYSSVAIVQEVGEGVDPARIGERITCTARHASYALYPAEHLRPIPSGVDSEAASFSTLAEIVMGGVRLSRVMFGESVAIIGAGLLGQLATQFCRRAGAWPLIVIDPAEGRLQTAKKMGATHILPMLAEEAREEVGR